MPYAKVFSNSPLESYVQRLYVCLHGFNPKPTQSHIQAHPLYRLGNHGFNSMWVPDPHLGDRPVLSRCVWRCSQTWGGHAQLPRVSGLWETFPAFSKSQKCVLKGHQEALRDARRLLVSLNTSGCDWRAPPITNRGPLRGHLWILLSADFSIHKDSGNWKRNPCKCQRLIV